MKPAVRGLAESQDERALSIEQFRKQGSRNQESGTSTELQHTWWLQSQDWQLR